MNKKQEAPEAQVTPKTTKAKVNATQPKAEEPGVSNEMLQQLLDRIAELEEKQGEQSSQVQTQPSIRLQQDEYIRVMSLLPYTLNLSTKPGGQGSHKRFTRFGEIKRILHRDLVDILDVHSNFVEAGYVYILNPEFIREQGLDDIYSKILTKEKIDQILETDSQTCVEMYESANETQREVIRDLLVEKYIQDKNSVDLNIIDRISRISKVDIVQRAEDHLALLNVPTEEEK